MLRKKILMFLLILTSGLFLIYLYKDLSGKDFFAMSGFEKNQRWMREEYYRREIPRIYFRKTGYFYLTGGRFYLNKIDREAAKIFDLQKHPILVGSLILIFMLL